MCYQDPRTQDYLGQVFAQERDAATVLHLSQRLAMDLGVDFFRRFLWGDKAVQALAAARVCAQSSAVLDPKDSLRVALLIDGEYAPPALSQQTLLYWVAELRGAHRLRARQLVQETGGEAVLLLRTAAENSSLSDPDQLSEVAWLLELAEAIDPARAIQEVEARLATGALPVVQAAQRLGVELPASLLQSADSQVRAAAISAGLADSALE